MYKSLQLGMVVLVCVAAAQSDVFARGFGGFHGGGGGSFGGFHGGGGSLGGFHGGDFGGFHAGGGYGGLPGGGGYHAGGFAGGAADFHGGGGLGGLSGGNPGGFHAGGYGAGAADFHGGYGGGFHAGGFDAGGFHGGEFGAGAVHGGSLNAPVNRGELNSFLGLPTDAGMHAAAGAAGGRDMVAGNEGAAAGRWGARGSVHEGPMGTTVAHGAAGAQGIAAGPGGVAAGGRAARGTVVEGPGGNVYAHGSTAGRGVAAGPEGVEAGRYAAHGSAVRGPEGNVYAHGAAAGGAVAGHGYMGAYGTHFYSPTFCAARGAAAQRWWAGSRVFTPGWVAGHPWAWCPAGVAAAAWATTAWRVATWPLVDEWLAWGVEPGYYVYGNNVTYQDNEVYYGTQPVATEQEYYQQAATIAGSGDSAPADNTQWLPLGVFGLMTQDEKTPEMVFQLAVDKAGTIRGNYYDQASGTTSPVTGSVDKKEQRAAWTVGSNKEMVVETGLYNLTQETSTALVHYGPDHTQQFVLVRIKQPEDEGAQGETAQ